MVDTLILAFHVWEVLNFDWWEVESTAEGVPAQEWVVESEIDCFRFSVAR